MIRTTSALNSFKSIDAYEASNGQILEALLEEGYTSIEIDTEIRNLKSNLKKLGIELASEIQHTDSNGNLFSNKSAYIDYNGLKTHLTEKMPQYKKHPKMLENDVSAIESIMLKRSGMTYDDIESCNAIFVTTNYTLVRQGNTFLHYSPYSMHIAPIISDMDLTTILWIKYAMSMSSEISTLQLVEHARAAMLPSASIMETFNNITQRLIKKGSMSEDEAAYMRYSAYARAEIVALCGGNASMLDDTSILAVRNRVREHFAIAEAERANQASAAAQQSARIAKAEKAKAIAAIEQASQAYAGFQKSNRVAKNAMAKATASASELESIRRKGRLEIAGLRTDAENTAKRKAHFLGRFVEILTSLIVIAIMVVAGGATAKAGLSQSIDVVGGIALIIAVISAIVLWAPAFKFSKRLYLIVSNKLFDQIYDVELKKRQKEIDRIVSISGLKK